MGTLVSEEKNFMLLPDSGKKKDLEVKAKETANNNKGGVLMLS